MQVATRCTLPAVTPPPRPHDIYIPPLACPFEVNLDDPPLPNLFDLLLELFELRSQDSLISEYFPRR
jgi:hypothetical protein